MFGVSAKSIISSRKNSALGKVNSEVEKMLKQVKKFFQKNPLDNYLKVELSADSYMRKMKTVLREILEKKGIKPKEDGENIADDFLYYSFEGEYVIFHLKKIVEE